MRSPALAIGWELWARNRRGLLAVVAFLILQSVVVWATAYFGSHGLLNLVTEVVHRLDLVVYLYLLSVFVYSDMTTRDKAAGFPPRLFALPVRTSWLVGVPMLCGALVTLALTFINHLSSDIYFSQSSGRIILWFFNWETALFLTAFLAGTQALCWTVVRAPLFRLALIVVGLPSAYVAVEIAKSLFGKELNIYLLPYYHNRLIWLFGVLLACAYVVAVVGVSLDRRGDRFNWATLGQWLLRALPTLPSRGGTFASPAAAQRWLEVRRHAGMLPLVVVVFFVVMLWSTFLPFGEGDVARTLIAFVCIPPLAGFLIGFSMGKSSFWARDLRLSSLAALRPMSSAALARAKLHAAGVSVILTWSVVLILAPTWAFLSGYSRVVVTHLEAWFGDLPVWELVLLAPLALVGLVGFTWLQIAAGMCLSLTGRIAVVNVVVLLYGALALLFVGLGVWVDFKPDAVPATQVILGCVGCAIGLLKLAAPVWMRSWYESHPEQVMTRLAPVWVVVAGCLVAALELGWPAGSVPAHLVALYAIVLLPFNRVRAVPAAIAWNRHR